MRTIDIHAHLVPQSLWRAAEAGVPWHGFRHEPGDGLGTVTGGGRRTQFSSPKVRFTRRSASPTWTRRASTSRWSRFTRRSSAITWTRGGGRAGARGQRRDRGDGPRAPAALRRPRHAARAGRPGRDRRARAGGDRPRPEGRRARHGGERRELGRPEVPAAVQGGGGDGRRAVLSPAAAEQLHGRAHGAPRAPQQPRRHRRGRDRRRGADPGRRARRVSGPESVHRPRRRPRVLRDGRIDRAWRALPRRAGASPSRRAPISGGCSTTRWWAARRPCAFSSTGSARTAWSSAATGHSCRGTRRPSRGSRG